LLPRAVLRDGSRRRTESVRKSDPLLGLGSDPTSWAWGWAWGQTPIRRTPGVGASELYGSAAAIWDILPQRTESVRKSDPVLGVGSDPTSPTSGFGCGVRPHVGVGCGSDPTSDPTSPHVGGGADSVHRGRTGPGHGRWKKLDLGRSRVYLWRTCETGSIHRPKAQIRFQVLVRMSAARPGPSSPGVIRCHKGTPP
jgi:hypothetical protein